MISVPIPKALGWLRGANVGGRAASLLLLAVLAIAGAPIRGNAAEVPAPAAEPQALVVGTSGDYAPFSTSPAKDDASAKNFNPGGFGPALMRAYAEDRGREVVFAPFTWPELPSHLASADFDVAVGGITVRWERALLGEFTVPVAHSGAVILTRDDGTERNIDAFNQPSIRIAVNAGGHLQRVTEARFNRASIFPINDNAAVPAALLAGDVDAAVTDTREAPHWQRLGTDLRVLPAFTRDRKAFLVTGAPSLRADLDAWLLDKEADGTLAAFRTRFLGDAPDAARTATPLIALLSAMDLRLRLMPAVAGAKRAIGAPIEVPERERVVLDSAVRSVERALAESDDAQARHLTPDAEAGVRALFRAQIEAAKGIQLRALREPSASENSSYDLTSTLRPALLRLGDQIAGLIAVLPSNLSAAEVHRVANQELAHPLLNEDERSAIADAIVALSESF